jgi:ABC-type Fe3+-siderophore transport system permease subunit
MIIQIVTYVILTLGWSIYRVRFFLNKKQPKDAVIYSCLMGLCIILGSLIIAHVHIPSTTVPARIIFEPVGKIILQQ